jgi:hypothetical protein
MSETKFINGVFIEEKEGKYGTYLSIGITEEGLENLQNLPASAKGWRNVTAFRQKGNENKFSASPSISLSASNHSAAKSAGKKFIEKVEDESSDLPF